MLAGQHSRAPKPKRRRAPVPQPRNGTEPAFSEQPHTRTRQPPELLPISQTLGLPVLKRPSPGGPPTPAGLNPPRRTLPSKPPLSQGRGGPALTVEVSGAPIKAGNGKDASTTPVTARGGGDRVHRPRGDS